MSSRNHTHYQLGTGDGCLRSSLCETYHIRHYNVCSTNGYQQIHRTTWCDFGADLVQTDNIRYEAAMANIRLKLLSKLVETSFHLRM